MLRRTFLKLAAAQPLVAVPFQDPSADVCRDRAIDIHAAGVRRSGSEYDLVAAYLGLLPEWMDSDEAEFLGGLSAVRKMIRDILNYDLVAVAKLITANRDSQVISAAVGGCGLDQLGLSLIVNVEGAFWNPRVAAGGYPGGDVPARVFTLLHELGHLCAADGFREDLNSKKDGEVNDRLIHDHFRKTIRNAADWGKRNRKAAGVSGS
jgi:hypothetical protein